MSEEAATTPTVDEPTEAQSADPTITAPTETPVVVKETAPAETDHPNENTAADNDDDANAAAEEEENSTANFAPVVGTFM
jgi:hypothetical protein